MLLFSSSSHERANRWLSLPTWPTKHCDAPFGDNNFISAIYWKLKDSSLLPNGATRRIQTTRSISTVHKTVQPKKAPSSSLKSVRKLLILNYLLSVNNCPINIMSRLATQGSGRTMQGNICGTALHRYVIVSMLEFIEKPFYWFIFFVWCVPGNHFILFNIIGKTARVIKLSMAHN